MSDQQLQVDPNHIINSLLQQNANLARDKAIAEGALATLQDAIATAQKEYEESQKRPDDGGAAVPSVVPAPQPASPATAAEPVPVG